MFIPTYVQVLMTWYVHGRPEENTAASPCTKDKLNTTVLLAQTLELPGVSYILNFRSLDKFPWPTTRVFPVVLETQPRIDVNSHLTYGRSTQQRCENAACKTLPHEGCDIASRQAQKKKRKRDQRTEHRIRSSASGASTEKTQIEFQNLHHIQWALRDARCSWRLDRKPLRP